jgi:formaldehyde-activating enzyme involved in methanogenesis
MMIAQAVADAIDEGVVDEEMMIDLSDVASDRDIARLAGRLDSLSRDKDFRRFLKEGPSEKEVSEEEVAESVPMDEMGDDDIESLMMERV